MRQHTILLAACLICGCRRAPDIAAMRAADKDWQRPQQIATADSSRPAWLLVFDGDSITVGHGLKPEQSYPNRLVGFLHDHGDNFDAFNLARCFDTISDLLGRAAQADMLANRRAYTRRLLIVWAGSNDLYFGAGPQVTAERMSGYVSGRSGAGYEVHVLAVMPRANERTPESFPRDREEFNSISRRNFGALFHDLGSPPLLDRVHLSPDGAYIAAKKALAIAE